MKKENVLQKLNRICFSQRLIELLTFANQIGAEENFEILLDSLYKMHGNKDFKDALQIANFIKSGKMFADFVENEKLILYKEFAEICDEINPQDFAHYSVVFFEILYDVDLISENVQEKILQKSAKILTEAQGLYKEEYFEYLMSVLSGEMQDFLLNEMNSEIMNEASILEYLAGKGKAGVS